jgi:alpha-ribazole phosphatase/probable phosphoglycerate mutase
MPVAVRAGIVLVPVPRLGGAGGRQPVVGHRLVRGQPLLRRRTDVHGGIGQPGHVVQQPVLCLVCDPVRLGQAEPGVHREAGLGPDAVPDPAQPQVLDVMHTRYRAQARLRRVDQVRVDGVHDPPVDVAGGAAQHDQDRHRDEQPDDRVGQRETGQHADRPRHDGQRGEPVRTGVQAVRDQRGRPDPAADPDPVARDELVAGEADQAGDDDDADVRDGLLVDQPAYGLVAGDDRGQGDHRDDEQPGQVLGPAVAVGVAAGAGTPAEDERDPQRDRGQRVGEVVHRVGQQRDRAGDQDDRQLRDRGRQQHDQADLRRPDAGGAGLQRRVDRAGGVVAVRPDQRPHPAGEPTVVMIVVVVGAHPAILPQVTGGRAMEIVCLRHAESENVLAGASGAVPHAPLTAHGRRQAAALHLAVSRTYASSALRARQTAELIGPPVTVLAELAEVGISAREGEIDAALRRETADVLRAWVVDGDLQCPLWTRQCGVGAPLPHAAPFPVRWDGSRWHCPRWPA